MVIIPLLPSVQDSFLYHKVVCSFHCIPGGAGSRISVAVSHALLFLSLRMVGALQSAWVSTINSMHLRAGWQQQHILP